jgi:hypothetical protein
MPDRSSGTAGAVIAGVVIGAVIGGAMVYFFLPGATAMAGESVPINVTLVPVRAGATSQGTVTLQNFSFNHPVYLFYSDTSDLQSFDQQATATSSTVPFHVTPKPTVTGCKKITVFAVTQSGAKDGELVVNPQDCP